MALPEKPLEVQGTAVELTLDDLCLFDPDASFRPLAVRAFLRERTNWSDEEIGKLTVGDLQKVVPQLWEAFQRSAVPLVNASS